MVLIRPYSLFSNAMMIDLRGEKYVYYREGWSCKCPQIIDIFGLISVIFFNPAYKIIFDNFPFKELNHFTTDAW